MQIDTTKVTPLPDQWPTEVWSKNADGEPIPPVSMTVEPDREWTERNFPQWPYTASRPARVYETRTATDAELKAASGRKSQT